MPLWIVLIYYLHDRPIIYGVIIMEFLTSTILSGIVYDLIKQQSQITAITLKDNLRNWILTDNELKVLTTQINNINDVDEMSEKALINNFDKNPIINQILVDAKYDNTINQIDQTHSGIGDNIARDKITNNYNK